MERRLAGILSADIVGYSRLMGADEAGTLQTLKKLFRELFSPKVAEHNGRIVKLLGDGALVEFASIVDAVKCAVSVQLDLADFSDHTSGAQPIQMRIGVNLGDIIIEGQDIYGDGVNVAARLQEIASPGGLTISATAFEHTSDKVDITFHDGGEQRLKNIETPVRVFHWSHGEALIVDKIDTSQAAATQSIKIPSIAVLPFENMSGDAEQEFFADGITEDVITELSRFSSLTVISRNSAFVYKGKAVSVEEVGKALGAKYVVEGSVRKAGNRIRVTVQLIDAETDAHIWAEKYDRDLEDIFEVQDEITSTIAAVLPGRIEAIHQKQIQRKTPDSMAAYECVMAGKILHHRTSPQDNKRAQELLEKAITLDPNYAHAHAWKACVVGQSWVHDWCDDRDATWQNVLEELQVALSLDDNDADVHRVLAAVNIAHSDLDKAAYHQERGLALNPNYDLIVVQQGELLTWLGQADEGIKWIERAMRLNPFHPERFWGHLGRAHFVAHQYDDVVAALQRLSAPDYVMHSLLAASYARLGDTESARQHAGLVRVQNPDFAINDHLDTLHYAREEDLRHHRESLQLAGLDT
ncbi:MAG: adenylate/guanylate cyclase domain-containing protein [Hyphomicrobiales bacterium]